jgi:hypothetical protein
MKQVRFITGRFRAAHWVAAMLLVILLSNCAPLSASDTVPAEQSDDSPATAVSSQAANTVTPEPVPQPTAAPLTFGPEPSDFPPGINPLTGQPVADPSLLKIPAMLVSISHFPATARPQAGLSFAPYVFEYSITEGQTRFLTVFYGQYPAPELPLKGDCEVRQGVFTKTGTVLGNRVWLDNNRNGIQDQDEPGIPGICVSLYDTGGKEVSRTTTDSNGYYGFNVRAGNEHSVRFVKPAYLDFTQPNVGDENHDSDANPATGQTPLVQIAEDNLLEDAGMIPSANYVAPTPDPKTAPKPQIGPVRSGRLLYAYIGNFFQNSCLIYAFASSEVLPLIPHCAFVTHEVSGGGNMLDLDRFKAIAEDNQRKTASRPFNYTRNVYSDTVPSGGRPAPQINVFFASLNQSGWFYDPLYGAYLRYVDMADKNAPGVLHADVDRLTGRQIHFENVVVVMADTDVVSPTNIDIHLDEGNTGNAYLFRDGQVFPIKWSTRAGTYEKQTGFRRPIQFVNNDASPASLKPGHTWVIIVTPFSTVKEQTVGVYLVGYAAPEGEAR